VIPVCHRCGIDLALAHCAWCNGPCQQFCCSRCGGHYCHRCLADHTRENWCEKSVAATSRKGA